jgi:hypothetical protein
LPGPGLFAQLVRDVWPAGWSRRQSTAASEQAPWREAVPLLAPAVPSRVPADAWAHVTRRPEETTSGPRGNRWLAWSASSRTRRRIVPRPGPVCSRSRVLASCGFAAWTRCPASSLSRGSEAPSSARATARLFGTAGSGHRAATPSRLALSASFVPLAGRFYWRLGCWRCASSAARCRVRDSRRRRRSRVARMGAGETEAGGSIPPPRHRRRIDWIVCGLASVDGLHGEGLTQHAGHPCWRTEISQPGPR